MTNFDPPTMGDVRFMLMYADCKHSKWVKFKDLLRLRRHPKVHVVHYSPLYQAAVDHLNSGLDFDSDTIKVALFSDGTFSIGEDQTTGE